MKKEHARWPVFFVSYAATAALAVGCMNFAHEAPGNSMSHLKAMAGRGGHSGGPRPQVSHSPSVDSNLTLDGAWQCADSGCTQSETLRTIKGKDITLEMTETIRDRVVALPDKLPSICLV